MNRIANKARYLKYLLLSFVLSLGLLASFASQASALIYPTNPQSGSVGLQGTIPSPPPSIGATITTPTNGQVFTTQPITVAGLCPSNLLIRLFDNNVFIGSATCSNGSYSITASLFDGQNQLVVIDYDALNQAGPQSNIVTVTYNNPNPGAGPGITLTSSYARIGANPGSTLTWPIIISGGVQPYAISVDWGDSSAAELVSQPNAATFNIEHVYATAGVYKVLIKATDTAGDIAYLQLVGVSNGQVTSSASNGSTKSTPKAPTKLSTALIWALFAVAIALPAASFWFGRQHEIHNIKKRLSSGDQPFR